MTFPTTLRVNIPNLAFCLIFIFFSDISLAMAHNNYVEIPIYFVSDRISMHHRFDKQSFEQVTTGQHVRFGRINVRVKTSPTDTLDANILSKLNWKVTTSSNNQSLSIVDQFHQTPEAYMAYGSPNPNSKLFNKNIDLIDDFINTFEKYVKNQTQAKFILFIHGCCLNINETFQTAGEIALNTKLPVLIFDWATPGRSQAPIIPEINAYRKSERALEISYHNFHDFMLFLAPYTKRYKCILIGHSMGNRLIYNELLRWCDHTNLYFDEMQWIAADKSLPAFLMEQNNICKFARRVYIFTDKSDPWLKLSQNLSSDVPRLGLSSQFFELGQNFNELYLDYPENRYFIDVDALKLKHNLPFRLIDKLINSDLADSADFTFQDVSAELGKHVLILKEKSPKQMGL